MSKPIIMWAAIIKSQRSEWINHETIRATRRASHAAYIAGYTPDYVDTALSRVRFARVEVKEVT